MNELSKKRKEERLTADYTGITILSDSAYNGLMGITVLYGLIMNAIMCYYCADYVNNLNPIVFIIGYFALTIAGTIISYKSKNPWVSFIGYNMIVLPVGLCVSLVVEEYGGLNGVIVQQAFMITAIITACMVVSGTIFPDFFHKIGGWLFVGLFGIVIVQIVSIFFHVYLGVIPWISAIIFSLYIGYDFIRSQDYKKTADNAIDCAIDIYLDIVNLFLDILQILGNKKNSD